MRRSILTRQDPEARDPVTQIGKPPPQTDEQRLISTIALIYDEAGAMASVLVPMIDRRTASVSAADAAEFVLKQWRNGGAARARLIAHANKSPERLQFEASLQSEIQQAVTSLARRSFSVERSRELHRAVVKVLRPKVPNMPIGQLRTLVSAAIDWTPERLALRLDDITDLLFRPKLAS